MPKDAPPPSPEADKMAEQVKVATEARNARSKQTGRLGSTGARKGEAMTIGSRAR